MGYKGHLLFSVLIMGESTLKKIPVQISAYKKQNFFVTGFRGVKLIQLYDNRKVYKNQ